MTHAQATKNTMAYSELETKLILSLSNRRGADSKSKDSGNPDEFLLMFREYPKPWPTIRLTMAYWDLSEAQDRDVSNDTARTYPSRSWARPEWFREISRDEFVTYINEM